MLQNKRKGLEFAGSMLLSAVVFLVIYKFIPIVYSTNDDRMIAEIISGQFTGRPESYAIQMTYGFTWFLSKLYEMTRAFNWYGIVLIGVQIFSFGAVLYRLQSFSKKWTNKLYILLAAILLYVGLWLKVYVQLTYTTTAAFVGMAAIFWYATSKADWKNLLMVGILANIAFSIRPNVFYLLLPATGLVYLWKLMGKKQMDKRTISANLPSTGGWHFCFRFFRLSHSISPKYFLMILTIRGDMVRMFCRYPTASRAGSNPPVSSISRRNKRMAD